MLQSLLRKWLMNAAQQQVRRRAATMAQSAAANARPAAEQGPPQVEQPNCHVGFVFALSIEDGGLVDRLSGAIRSRGADFVLREGGLHGKRMVIIESGPGQDAAARAAAALVLGHRPNWIVSAGFAGGLQPQMAQGDILLADEIVDQSGRSLSIDCKLRGELTHDGGRVHVGRLLTIDRVVDEVAEKQSLGQSYAALAVDMESFAVASVCRLESIRFLSVRIISDAVDHALPKDVDRLLKQRTTAGRLGAAAGAIVRRPGSIKDLWQLKEDALVASNRLGAFLEYLVAQLP